MSLFPRPPEYAHRTRREAPRRPSGGWFIALNLESLWEGDTVITGLNVDEVLEWISHLPTLDGAGGKMPKIKSLFTVTDCEICGERKLTFGGLYAYLCSACWTTTLSWVQLPQDHRWALARAFHLIALAPAAQA